MRVLRRFVSTVLLLCLMNMVMVQKVLELPPLLVTIGTVLLAAYFAIFNIRPRKEGSIPQRLKIMMGGYELTLIAGICVLLEAVLYVYLLFYAYNRFSTAALLVTALISMIVIAILMFNGCTRMLITSTQITLLRKSLLIFLWWLPVMNVILIIQCCRKVHNEYNYECIKLALNETRKESEICKTQYPVLLLHGIFFRDWRFFNYWGRIPKELIKNGATIYYGNQQSAATVAASALEIKARILEITEKEHCQKVNIIAHSKGGLDARYAISALGMAPYVASLTTINTPHQGSDLADTLIGIFPPKILLSVSKKYNALFKKLGDHGPDFYKSVNELTGETAVRRNAQLVDCPDVFYQSVGSQMNRASGAGFPLNLGYAIVHPTGGANDGLVCAQSVPWGHFMGILSTNNKRGISHGDMIDLTRKNIPGFDVREFYVDLVKGLKEKQF